MLTTSVLIDHGCAGHMTAHEGLGLYMEATCEGYDT